VCVNGSDPDGDNDCSNGAGARCTDSDHDCGIGPNGEPEVCVNGVDPDGDGDCVVSTVKAARVAALPFTGYDVIGALTLGVLLLGVGFGTRRVLARRADRSNS
jgi:hypothetical protein